MKRYLAFYGDRYYPSGGIDDFEGDYDTVEEARKAIDKAHSKNPSYGIEWDSAWAHVWDSETRKKVSQI